MSEGMLISKRVIRCAYEVNNTLGAGYFEKVYENALCVEFRQSGISCSRQQRYEIEYRNENIGDYIADLVVENKLLIELKALVALSKEHEAQLMNYLRKV